MLNLILLGRVLGFGCPTLQEKCTFDTNGAHYFRGVSASGTQAVVEGIFTLPSNHSTVMIIQMQDGTYDPRNGNSSVGPLFPPFYGGNGGPFTSGGNGYLSLERAGQYEFSFVSSTERNGTQTILKLFLPLSHNFSSAGAARFQVVSFLMCDNMTVESYPSIPWDGKVGGVLPIIGKNIHFNVDISMDATGFRGGRANVTNVSNITSDVSYGSQYAPTNGHAFKGEGFLGSPQFPPQSGSYLGQEDCGRGAPGNAGGGGTSTAGGGSGGANGGNGGSGQIGGRVYDGNFYFSAGSRLFGGYKMPSDEPNLLFLGALATNSEGN